MKVTTILVCTGEYILGTVGRYGIQLYVCHVCVATCHVLDLFFSFHLLWSWFFKIKRKGWKSLSVPPTNYLQHTL